MQTRLAVAALAACGVATAGFMPPAAGALAPASAVQAPASTVSTVAMAAAGTTPTGFGLQHHAFGTKIAGNRVVRSGPTANSIIGCTNLAGLTRSNKVAGAKLPPLVTANEIASRGVTTKDNGVVSVTSKNTITNGALLGGEIRFRGLSSQSRTWHNKRGFHNRVTMDLARLKIDGNPVALTGGTQRLDVSGGTLVVFSRSFHKGGGAASARGIVLRLVLDDGTRVLVGSSFSRMLNRVFGPMSGSTWGSQVDALDGSVTSGRTAFQVMPCQGTRGVVRENSTAGIDVGGVVSTSDIATHVWGIQRPSLQRGYTQAQIARATLGTLGFTATGIVSKANVKRAGGGLKRNARGTHLVGLVGPGGNDLRDRLRPGQPVDIAGLGRVTFKQVNRVRNGIEVVALEVRLLDDTTVELGHSTMKIKKN